MSIYEPHRIEVNTDGMWNETEYQKIKAGDSFRMFHEDGNPFLYELEHEVEYTANSEPYFNEELGAWLINIK